MASIRATAVIVLAASLAPPVLAAPFVYPAKGQKNDQMERDKIECQRWATNQTGFDPMARQTASSPRPQEQGGLLGGAARGAALGAVTGAIAGDAGKGAAIGAAGGGMIGGMRRRQSHREQDQWAQDQAAQQNAARDEFDRAWAVCLEGRGYTVR